jgi:hypothetical protein
MTNIEKIKEAEKVKRIIEFQGYIIFREELERLGEPVPGFVVAEMSLYYGNEYIELECALAAVPRDYSKTRQISIFVSADEKHYKDYKSYKNLTEEEAIKFQEILLATYKRLSELEYEDFIAKEKLKYGIIQETKN